MLTGDAKHLADIKAVIVLDLFSHVGEMMEAFPAVRSNYKVNLFYHGFAADMVENMFITNFVQEQLVDKYLADEKLPGGEDLAKSMSDDLIEPMPNPPKLNVLTLSGSEDEMKKLAIHADVVQKWTSHTNGQINKKFIGWLDEFTENGHIITDSTENSKELKRKAAPTPTDGDASPGSKVRKMIPQNNVTPDEIKEALLYEVKLASAPKDSAVLQVRQGNAIYLFNKSSSEVKLPCGTFLCGFGKGGFKEIKKDSEEKGVPSPVIISLLLRPSLPSLAPPPPPACAVPLLCLSLAPPAPLPPPACHPPSAHLRPPSLPPPAPPLLRFPPSALPPYCPPFPNPT